MIVAVKCPQIQTLMADTTHPVLSIESLEEITGQKTSSSNPRLFVLRFTDEEFSKQRKLITKVKKIWPVVDIIAWIQSAKAKTVLKAMDLGVANCYLEADPAGLKTMILSTMEKQNFVTALAIEETTQRVENSFEGIYSRSPKMWDIFEQIQQVATTDASVLILGETGTGKELIARAIHRKSNKSGKFVAINCAAIPPDLINSELFGHVKGAFTGADTNKNGLFQYADGGTILLDEIGNMPESSQNHLLRVLQEKKFRPVGSHAEKEVDVRIIAATSQPLETYIQAGKFREDLFYRLDVLRFLVPPMRERPEDIIFLMHHFLKLFCKQYQISFPKIGDGLMDALTQYDWPGNVRQLSNVAERLILSYPEQKLTAAKFRAITRPYRGKQKKAPQKEVSDSKPAEPLSQPVESLPDPATAQITVKIDPEMTYDQTVGEAIKAIERTYFENLLHSSKHKMQVSADKAGISRRTLLRKLKQYDLR